MAGPQIGKQLTERGWRQGKLVAGAAVQARCFIWQGREDLNAESSGRCQNPWSVQELTSLPSTTFSAGDSLVVASQSCDIEKPPTSEPYVELVRAFWTTDKNIINSARKNSVRYYPLRSRRLEDGKEQVLIADATTRLFAEKAALLDITPEDCFESNDDIPLFWFQLWLAMRYNRPGIEQPLADAIQEPIASAYQQLSDSDDVKRILDDCVSEIRFVVHNDTAPFRVELLLMRNEFANAPIPNPEDEAILTGWLHDVIRQHGRAEVVDCDVYDSQTMSLRDYMKSTPLPLDYSSLPEGARPDYSPQSRLKRLTR